MGGMGTYLRGSGVGLYTGPARGVGRDTAGFFQPGQSPASRRER